MEEIIVKTQQELDAIKPDYEGTIYIEGGTEDSPLVLRVRFEYAEVIARGSCQLDMRENATVQDMWENATVQDMRGNATVQRMWENATVQRMRGNATVQRMWENATVQRMWENATVQDMWGNATVQDMWGNATVQDMWGNATVQRMWENATVQDMWGNATVQDMWGNATVQRMWENATVQRMWENATAIDLYGEAMVSAYGTNKITCHGYNIVRTRESNKANLTLVMNGNSHLIVIPEFEPSFEEYAKRYPVEVTGTKAIFYKAVHKDGSCYISDYDKSFTYEIGKKVVTDCNPEQDKSCSYGLHVAHKSWALVFGAEWSDMALLECEVPVKDIVVSRDCDGKVRTPSLKVIREVPREEYYA